MVFQKKLNCLLLNGRRYIIASFTDSPIVPLAPYRPSVDLNIMNTALQYKQQHYDANVQKIQSTVDNVAGLDIYRPVDKQYLQDRVGELTSKLNEIGGSDFSSATVVDQAVGMAAPLYKDQNIINAVTSTSAIKKLIGDQKQLKNKHPELYSAQNEWWDSREVQKYLASGKVGDTYNGGTEATQYYDWHKPIDEVLDKMEPGVDYTINSDGKFQYFINKTKITLPSDVEDTVNRIIDGDPRIQNQMKIDAQYTYKDYDAPSLKKHINTYYDAQINQHQALIDEYNAKLDTDPTNKEAQEKMKGFIADSTDLINRMKQTKKQYNDYFDNGYSIDQIKQTYFDDAVRKGYISDYQQHDRELEIKTNETAKTQAENYLAQERIGIEAGNLGVSKAKLINETIAQGRNPWTGHAITMDDPDLYQQYVNANIKNFNPDGTWTVGGQKGAGTIGGPNGGLQNTATGTTTGEYTRDTHLKRIESAKNDLDAIEENLKKEYSKLPENKYEIGSPQFAAQYAQWKANQEQHRAKNEPVDDNYSRYVEATKQDKIYKSTLQQVDDKILKDATDKYSINNLSPVTIHGLRIEQPNGSTANTLSVDPKNHQEFFTKFYKFGKEVDKLVSENVQKGHENLAPEDMDKILKIVANSYKGDIDYNIFKAFADAGFSKFDEGRQKLIAPVDNLLSLRDQQIAKDYESRGQTLTYPSVVIPEEYGKKQGYPQLVSGAIKNASPNKALEVDPKKIDVVDAYMDEKHDTYIRYYNNTGDKKSDLLSVKVPSAQILPLLNPDPNWKIQAAIKMSPSQMTPTTGDAVLSSDNGKIRYAISESFIPGAGYTLYLLDQKGNKIPFNRGVDKSGKLRPPYSNIQEMMNDVNSLSAGVNPATGKQLTPQEIIEIAKNSYKKSE